MIILVFLGTFFRFHAYVMVRYFPARKRVKRQFYLVNALGIIHVYSIIKEATQITSCPAIIGVAITSCFAAARLLFFATFGASRRPK